MSCKNDTPVAGMRPGNVEVSEGRSGPTGWLPAFLILCSSCQNPRSSYHSGRIARRTEPFYFLLPRRGFLTRLCWIFFLFLGGLLMMNVPLPIYSAL